MSEILNRREQIKAASLPPEIADASELVTKTDYATASKAGVVKVGNNINVASGKISVPAASDEVAGVVKVGTGLSVDENGALNVTGGSGGGFTADVLFTEGESPTPLAKNATVTLAHNYSDYKMISITMRRGTDGCTTCFYDATVTMKQLVPFVDASGIWALCGTSFSALAPTTLTIADASNTTNMYIHKVVGYK